MNDKLQPYRRPSSYLWTHVFVELTNACNFHCDFCPSDSMRRPRARMSGSMWKKILIEIAEKKLSDTICFHQLGEPLLHPDIFDAIEFANSLHLSVILFTNGALLDEDRSRRLIQSLKRGIVVLSLQDIRPETFSSRSRNMLSWSEYFKRLMDFLVQADAAGLSVQLDCLADLRSIGWSLTKYRKEKREIQRFYDDLSRSLGSLQPSRISILKPMINYPLGKKSTLYIKPKGTWDNQLRPPGTTVIKSMHGHCSIMHDTFVIQCDGTCTYCCCDHEGMLDLGNANQCSLEEIFLGEKSQRIISGEAEGRFVEERCRECKGRLIDSKTKKRVLDRPLYAEFYYLRDHLARHGWRELWKKAGGNLRRRLLASK
jgi:organic radical activating enzyme